MTVPIAGVAPAALTPDQAAEYAAQLRDRDPEAADRFLRTPVPADAVAVVVGWLAMNGLRELFPETLAIDIGTDGTMLVTRFRWKAGARDTLDNVARRDGVEVIEVKQSPISVQPDDRVMRAMFVSGVPVRWLPGPAELPAPDYVDAIDGVRPNVLAEHAPLIDGWLIPNGISEWVPECAVFVVTGGQTITYDAYRFTDEPLTIGDTTWPGGRGWGRNIVTRHDVDPSIAWEDDAVIVEHRTVPLVLAPNQRTRTLFAESALTLIER